MGLHATGELPRCSSPALCVAELPSAVHARQLQTRSMAHVSTEAELRARSRARIRIGAQLRARCKARVSWVSRRAAAERMMAKRAVEAQAQGQAAAGAKRKRNRTKAIPGVSAAALSVSDAAAGQPPTRTEAQASLERAAEGPQGAEPAGKAPPQGQPAAGAKPGEPHGSKLAHRQSCRRWNGEEGSCKFGAKCRYSPYCAPNMPSASIARPGEWS